MEQPNPETAQQYPVPFTIALLLAGIGLLAAGVAGLSACILVMYSLMNGTVLLMSPTIIAIVLAGIFVYLVYPTGKSWTNRFLIPILVGLCLFNFLVMVFDMFTGRQFGDMVMVLGLAGFIGFVAFSVFFACSYICSGTGIPLSRGNAVVAAGVVATITSLTGMVDMWYHFYTGWHLFGIFAMLFTGGLITIMAMSVSLLIAACVVLMKGLKKLSDIESD